MKKNYIELCWCVEGYSNNWRKMHRYPMRRKYKNRHTYPCSELKKIGLCNLPFC